MSTYINTHFKKLYWLTGAALLLGSLVSLVIVLPQAQSSILAYILAYWLPIFTPTLILCGLVVFAVLETIRSKRVWWGTLGYVLLTCIATVYALLAFFFVLFSIGGFS